MRSPNVSDISVDSAARSPHMSTSPLRNSLRIFTYAELRSATKNFGRSMMVGEGGFGSVYRGAIKTLESPRSKIEVAVKRLNRKGLQGHKEWLQEVTVLGIADHPNLVKLIGYCAEDDERGMQLLLVYEFMPNGSVEDHLFRESSAPLSWPMRVKIALDAAKGLNYLHEGIDPRVGQIIFRDFKTSNILLDKEWNAKLSDFGMSRQGPKEGLTHVSTAVVGTVGYSAPEYIQTGRLTAKTDIWSYGVVLFELITGRHPIDKNRPKSEQKLIQWVKPSLSDSKKIQSILDPRLHGHYSVRSAFRLSKVAHLCLRLNPKARPEMSKVLEMVNQIAESSAREETISPFLSIFTEQERGKPGEEKSKGKHKKTKYLRTLIKRLKSADGWSFHWPSWARKTALSS